MSAEHNSGYRPQGHETVRDIVGLSLDLLDFHVSGRDHLSCMRESPALIVFAPHCGHPDSLAVRKSFPDDLRETLVFPAPTDYWGSPWRRFVGSLGVQTVPMGRADSGPVSVQRGMENIVSLLRRGFSPVLSPEGTRNDPGKPMEDREFKPGIAEIMLRTGCVYPVIPVRLFGLEAILPRGMLIPRLFTPEGRRKKAFVVIGNPMVIEIPDDDILNGTSPKRKKRWRIDIMSGLKKQFLQMNTES